MISGHWLENVINGPAHHTLHHLHFTVNYGQYFTWSDRVRSSLPLPPFTRHRSPVFDPFISMLTSPFPFLFCGVVR
jgi:hypothetical protein